MTVTPHRHLHSFSAKTTLMALERAPSGLQSVSLALPLIDPLVALGALAADYPNYFYWEQGDRAVAAFGTAVAQHICGPDRFRVAEAFVAQVHSQLRGGFSPVQPLVYCYFPFFDQPTPALEPFSTSYLCLPQWQVERRKDRSYLIANVPATLSVDVLNQALEAFVAQLCQLVSDKISVVTHPSWSEEAEVFLEPQIDRALADIEQRQLQKIVLAHSRQLTSPQAFSISRSLANLRHNYPDCYTFAVGDGQGHCFLGASPERLLAVADRQLTSDALAGSAPRGATAATDRQFANELLANAKEQHEHRLVRDFILEQLHNLQLQPTCMATPQLLQLTNIQHIWTPIQAALPAEMSPLQVLAALHPTPAVAGLPQNLACQKIQEYEHTARGLYASPLGWLDLAGNCELVVGIRSALIGDRQARLYAGAGIVEGSEAAREVAEIQLKFQPLYRALSI